MPDVPDVRATSHDRHDTMLVAALAAGDLAGTDRDQAIAQTQSCSDCAALHADLIAIARATATLPPPIAASGLDFRLSPQQAERLRRTGWRRFVPSLSGRFALTRPLGISLATFGLIGLVIGNLGLGGMAASAPTSGAGSPPGAASLPSTVDIQAGGESSSDGRNALGPIASPAASAAAAASAGPAASTNDGQFLHASPAASSGTTTTAAGASGAPRSLGTTEYPVPAAPSGGQTGQAEGQVGTLTVTGNTGGPSLSNVVFGGAIVLGLILLVASRRRGPAPG